jgi:hypothetical protein
MAVAGRKLKPEEERRNRTAPTHEWTEVERIPYEGDVPLLPQRWGLDPIEGVKVRLQWPARTRQWWRVISSMPHCVLWDEADWSYALDVAEVHARFVEGANGTELRIREKLLGNTMDARRDLRIRYVDPRPEQTRAAGVTNLDDYRDL